MMELIKIKCLSILYFIILELKGLKWEAVEDMSLYSVLCPTL